MIAGGRHQRDRGAILPIVLVVIVALALVVVGIATYTTTTLRYGQVVEDRSDEFAAAQAAMDDALERLELLRSLCGTDQSGGQVPANPSFPLINGIQASATCEVVGGLLPATTGWAVVVTGEDVINTATGERYSDPANRYVLDLTGGGDPVIEGPIFIDVPDPANEFFAGTGSNVVEIQKGDLWYQDDACAGGVPDPMTPEEFAFVRNDTPADQVPNLVFLPATRGLYCTNGSWVNIFGSVGPALDASYATVSTGPAANPDPAPDGPEDGACKVFEPGLYTSPPVLAANNYFRSGVYIFRDIDALNFGGNKATFGHRTDDSGYPVLTENDDPATCQNERLADPSDEGAVVYMDTNSRFIVGNNSSLEISGRDIDDSSGPEPVTYRMALHALGTSTPTTATALVSADPGSSKDVAFSGLLWAPYQRVSIGAVSADKDAAFRGGMVVAVFEGTISNAPGGGFLIRVASVDASSKVRLISTAGQTSVVVIADWRPTTGELAVNSWRVCERSGC